MIKRFDLAGPKTKKINTDRVYTTSTTYQYLPDTTRPRDKMPPSRREEIEAKRLKLQQLRKQRQERERQEKLKLQEQEQQQQQPNQADQSQEIDPYNDSQQHGHTPLTPLSPRSPNSSFSRHNVDQLVDELVTRTPDISRHNRSSLSNFSSRDNLRTPTAIDQAASEQLPIHSLPIPVSESDHQAGPVYVDASVQTDFFNKPTADELAVAGATVGAERMTYDKAVQTLDFQIRKEEALAQQQRELEQRIRAQVESDFAEQRQAQQQQQKENNVLTPDIKSRNQINIDDLESDSDSDSNNLEFFNLKKISEKLNEEKQSLDLSAKQEKLDSFFNQSFKIINRALQTNDLDLLKDYGSKSLYGEEDDNVNIAKENANTKGNSSVDIVQLQSFYNDLFSGDRTINSLDWSTALEELVVAAYSSKGFGNSGSPLLNDFSNHLNMSDSEFDDNSVVQIWNLNYSNNLPEFHFKSSTEILSVAFNKLNPRIIYGGGYNGKIFSWDTRTNHSDPVAVTNLNSGKSFSHLYPVYTLQHKVKNSAGTITTDSENPGMLISASTDGTISSWSPYSLQSPATVPLHLKAPTGLLSRYDELAPVAMDFLNNDPNGMLVGCDDGKIYRVKDWNNKLLTSVSGKSPGSIDSKNIFQGHNGFPVTGLSCSKSNNEELSQLFLTSGFDWNIKLWKYGSGARLPNNKAKYKQYASKKSSSWILENDSASELEHTVGLIDMISPVLELNRDDVVMDVKWRPGASHQFASVGGNGKLEYWDLTKDTVSPIAEVEPINDSEYNRNHKQKGYDYAAHKSGKALTKVVFNGNGSKIATGGLDGYLNIYTVEDAAEQKDAAAASSFADEVMKKLFV